MRSVTTVLANKSVLVPCSDGIAMRTGFRRKARIHAVQACANLLAGLDPLAYVRKILKNEQANIAFCRIFNNGLADFVVDLFHMSFLSAGSLSKWLPGAS